jgi:hypothetical protein
MPRGKKIDAVKWTWSVNNFVIRHTDGSTRYAKKNERIKSRAIADAVSHAGEWVPLRSEYDRYYSKARSKENKAALRRLRA